MLDYQFVNNRIFDALACGLPVISDSCEKLRIFFRMQFFIMKQKKILTGVSVLLRQIMPV